MSEPVHLSGSVHDCSIDCNCDGEGVETSVLAGACIAALPESPDALIGAYTVCEMLRASMQLLMEDESVTPLLLVSCIGDMIGHIGVTLVDALPIDEMDAVSDRLRNALAAIVTTSIE